MTRYHSAPALEAAAAADTGGPCEGPERLHQSPRAADMGTPG
jgi:hypothetical protein